MHKTEVTRLRLANFKAFSSTQEISIKPLTLIYGANSSGKSSILHALVLANHAMKTGSLDVHHPKIGGHSIDLGGFLQYCHQHQSHTNVVLGFDCVSRSHKTEAPYIVQSNIEFGIDRDNKARRDVDRNRVNISVNHCKMSVDEEPLFEMSEVKSGSGVLRIDSHNPNHNTFNMMVESIRSKLRSDRIVPESGELREAFRRFIPTVYIHCHHFLPQVNRWKDHQRLDPLSTFSSPFGSRTIADYLAGTGSVLSSFRRQKGQSKEDIKAKKEQLFLQELREFFDSHNKKIVSFLDRVEYLGPFRPYPSRSYAPSSVQTELESQISGANVWDWVLNDDTVRREINEWLQVEDRLQTPYEIKVDTLLAADRVGSYLDDMRQPDFPRRGSHSSERIVNHLAHAPDSVRRLMLRDQRTKTRVSFRDVGVGISQVLPILIATFAAHRSCIAVEQPELHIHPGLQADLADVFLTSAMTRANRFLIETHSEHMILRVLRRIRESTHGSIEAGTFPVSPEDVSVIFVQGGKDGAEVIELPITEDGEFEAPWPGGFFAERRKEL